MDLSIDLPDWGQKHETSTTEERLDTLQFFVTNGIPFKRSDDFFFENQKCSCEEHEARPTVYLKPYVKFYHPCRATKRARLF